MQEKTTFGVIVGTRGCFNSELAVAGRKELTARLGKLGYGHVILPADATPTGAVETYQDAKKCADLFRKQADRIDGVVVSLPNFGDELGIVNALDRAKLNVPVLVHAADDDIDKVDVASRRDSFCGKLSVCSNFYQYGIPFTDTTWHTCPLDSDVFAHDLDFFARVCRVVKGMSRARVGAIGARPGAFQTMRFSEKLFQGAGITVVTVDMSEIIGAATAMDDGAKDVKARVAEIRAYGNVPSCVAKSKVARQARLSLAMENWMKANEVDCAAVQCWTSLQQNYGCGACVSMSMMSEKLIPCACEVDLGGVLSMYALALATRRPAALLDWNNNYGDDRDMCVSTHCSNFPRSFIGGDVEISNLDVLGTTLGQENCFGAVKGKVQAGPMTYFRISTDDFRGEIKTYMGEGEFTDDPFNMSGGIAVCRVPALQKLMKFMCRNGFEHHVGMVRGHCGRIIHEAVETYLGWDVYHHAEAEQ